MSEIQRLAAAIKTISEKYLTNVVKSDDKEAILKWSLRLADYSTRLSVLVAAPLTKEEVAVLVPDGMTQAEAIAIQRAAHAALANGSVPVPADKEGPLSLYTRAQTLDYLAQLINCLDANALLPNASGPGMTILPGTPRYPLPESDRKLYVELVADLTEAGAYTDAEIDGAMDRLAANLDAGISLDPAVAEGVA